MGASTARPRGAAACTLPSGLGIGQIVVVLERHFQGQRQTTESLPHPFGRELERVGAVFVGRVAVFGLEIGCGKFELFDEALLQRL